MSAANPVNPSAEDLLTRNRDWAARNDHLHEGLAREQRPRVSSGSNLYNLIIIRKKYLNHLGLVARML